MVNSQSDVVGTHESKTYVPKWLIRFWRFISDPDVVYWATFFIGATLIIGYIFLGEGGGGYKISLQIAKELGVAFVIASILGYTIEKFNNHRHEQRELSFQTDLENVAKKLLSMMATEQAHKIDSVRVKVAKDVVEAVYAASIPREVLAALTKFVLQAPKIRICHETKIELHRLDDYRVSQGYRYSSDEDRAKDKGHVAVVYVAKWTDQNISDDSLEISAPVQVVKDGLQINGISGFCSFRAFLPGSNDAERILIDIPSEEALRRSGLVAADSAQELSFEFVAEGVPFQGQVSFWLKQVMIQDLKDELILMCAVPAISAQLNVIAEKNFNAIVSSIHSEDVVELGHEADWHQHERRWRLRTALLPCQGFVLNWDEKGGKGSG